jgi:hypothetical protein
LRPVWIGVYGHVSHEVSVYLLEVFYREENETDRFDPYATELNQDKEQEETASSEKKQQPEDQHSAKARTSNLNVSGCGLLHIFLIFTVTDEAYPI